MKLSHTEFKLLYFLMANAHRLVSERRFDTQGLGGRVLGNTDNLRTYVRYLRQKIEVTPDPTHIITERGIGICLCTLASRRYCPGCKEAIPYVWTSGPTE